MSVTSNKSKDLETNQAKIRNRLTPFWTLTSLMDDTDALRKLSATEDGLKLLKSLVKRCNDNKSIILELIDKTN